MASCKRYSEEFISRLVDNEVSPGDYDAFIRHKAFCRECSETETAFRNMADVFEKHAQSGAAHIRKHLPPVLSERRARRSRFPRGFKRPAMGIGLASMAFAALIIILTVRPLPMDSMTGPSAIVNSVDTYGSSVMIIESPDAQHTIIWFSDSSMDGLKA